MKNALVAMVCTLGVVACAGDNRRVEDPSAATVTTTETTTTSGTPSDDARAAARRTSASANGAVARPSTGNAANANTNAPVAPRDGLETSRDARPEVQRESGSNPANPVVTGYGSGAPAPGVVANPGAADGTKDANNTKINDRDRHGALTPMDQGGGNDRDITAAIRRSVVGDGALSFSAKNVKIITVSGKVTLRGPVKTDAEKSAIEAKAKSTAGVSEVDNQLEVKK